MHRMRSSTESSGIKSDSLLVNLAVYFFILLVFIIVVGTLFALKKSKKFKDRAEKTIDGIKRKTFWNNIIRSVTISYL
jgi:amino acid transporter